MGFRVELEGDGVSNGRTDVGWVEDQSAKADDYFVVDGAGRGVGRFCRKEERASKFRLEGKDGDDESDTDEATPHNSNKS
jgi:hypothetical protein